MMKRSVLIIEDEPIQREVLEKLVLEVDAGAIVYTADNAATAYQILMERTIDVFLVDIILNEDKSSDISGVKLVEQIRTIPKYMFSPVLFITSLEDATGYAYKDLNCLGYVEKPFSPEHVKQLVKKAFYFPTMKNQSATFCFRKDGILYPVKIADIVYMDSTNRMINIHTANGDVLEVPYKTLKEILDEMDADCMMQCSRRAIVNKDYILNLDIANRYITLKNTSEKLEIGKVFRKKVLAEFGL